MIDGPRACRPDEFDETIALINATFRANSDQNIRTDYPLIFNHQELDCMRILKVDDRVVAHVPVAPRQIIAGDDAFTVGIISPTVTHPDHRHNGYATLCLRDCVRLMMENDWPVSTLWTEEATFPFYHNSGWEAVANQGWMYALGPEDAELFRAADYEIVPFNPDISDHLDAVMGYHDAERYIVSRTRNEYRALLTLPKIDTQLASRGSQVAAYLSCGDGTNKPGLIEAGGSPQAVEILIRQAVRTRDREIQAITNLTPTVLDDVLAARVPQFRRPIEQAAGVGPQMLRINNLSLFLNIAGHLRARAAGVSGAVTLRCVDTDEVVTLEFRDGQVAFDGAPCSEPVALNRRQMVQLIFGAHPSHDPVELPLAASDLLNRIFPYYFPVWELDHS